MAKPVRKKSFHWAAVCQCPPAPSTFSPHASGRSTLYPWSGRPRGFGTKPKLLAKWVPVVTVRVGEVSDYIFYVPVWSCVSIYMKPIYYFIAFLQFLFYLGHYYWRLKLSPCWMDKHILVHSDNGILLNNEKEWATVHPLTQINL